jgi:GNAT superfamily N-acetyltransferase
MMTLRVPELLTVAHDVAQFDCGSAPLNNYLRRFALSNNAAGSARTYVACEDERARVIGYYSLCAGSIDKATAAERVSKGMPSHPIPVILLARLAVEQGRQGQGLGAALLKDALRRCLNAADSIGIRAVLVHAKDAQAADFYAHFGFVPSPTDALHLMLLIKDIRCAL